MNFFSFALAGISIACIVRWGMWVHRRSNQSWESIAAHLEPGWNSPAWTEIPETSESTPEERWSRVNGARGLCTMYQNAKVMQEMASYASRQDSGIDPMLLAELRSDALQIRLLVVVALAQYAMHQVNEEICGKAGRAASIYQEMSQRMSDLLQVGTPAMQFVGAR